MFTLDARLREDTIVVGAFELSLVLLHRDANYPWCILVPQVASISEIHHLELGDQRRLIRESSQLAQAMVDNFAPDKMNVAALGNIVSQLHIHHVARYQSDAAWPGPIWGAVSAKSYGEEALNLRVERLRSALSGEGFTSEPDAR